MMHELLLQRVLAEAATHAALVVLNPLTVLSGALIRKGGWQATRLRLLVDADVVLLAHAAQVELLGRVLHH